MSMLRILGAGMTGLAAGIASGKPVYEGEKTPGGICSSYYRRPGLRTRFTTVPQDGEAYRFEIGGGHWIHSDDGVISSFIRSLTPVEHYARRSAVYLSDLEMFVPYPIQNHLHNLQAGLVAKALNEMIQGALSKDDVVTMAEWLRANFGPTLCELFFDPFHERYTAGLCGAIAPQDDYKSPCSLPAVLQGAFGKTSAAGYNVRFMYPLQGLNALAQRMAAMADVHYDKRVATIDVSRKLLEFADGSGLHYDCLISTLPLNRLMELTGLEVRSRPDPFNSTLVINIGAVRGSRCPDAHWVYISKSESGFHRVGFYSNVDSLFLPSSARGSNGRVGVYVELAYPGGQKPDDAEVEAVSNRVVAELEKWGWIIGQEVLDTTWIDVAYTWSWPGSQWKKEALRLLETHDIHQVGRYARWTSGASQGIAHSIRDGLAAGAAMGRALECRTSLAQLTEWSTRTSRDAGG